MASNYWLIASYIKVTAPTYTTPLLAVITVMLRGWQWSWNYADHLQTSNRKIQSGVIKCHPLFSLLSKPFIKWHIVEPEKNMPTTFHMYGIPFRKIHGNFVHRCTLGKFLSSNMEMGVLYTYSVNHILCYDHISLKKKIHAISQIQSHIPDSIWAYRSDIC